MSDLVRPTPILSEPDARSIGSAGEALFGHWHAILAIGLNALPDKPEETAAAALRALWFRAADILLSAEAACERTLVPLTSTLHSQLAGWVGKRLAGMPLAHITERQRFMGVELLAGPAALIPRRETELLGLAALGLLTAMPGGGAGTLVLDACTGSGNLALGLASRVAGARVLIADLSEEAVDLARRNVAHCGLQGRVEVRQGDLLAPFDTADIVGHVDLIVCNPPYISSGKLADMPAEIADFEPTLAFDGGPFGVRILQRLVREAPRFLRPGGWLAFEVGLGQGPAVVKRLTPAAGFDEVRCVADENAQTRAILARASRAA